MRGTSSRRASSECRVPVAGPTSTPPHRPSCAGVAAATPPPWRAVTTGAHTSPPPESRGELNRRRLGGRPGRRAAEIHAAGARADEAAGDRGERGLTGAVRSGQADERPFAGLDIDAAARLGPAVALLQACCAQHRRHGPPLTRDCSYL